MLDRLQAALDFSVARSREAEALFKEWAPRVGDPEVRALFAELAAAERGRTEMLSRMKPDELSPPTDEAPDLADLLVDVGAVPGSTLEKAISAAVRRKGVTAALYERIARLGGEACSFFRAMAEEDRRSARALEAYAARLVRRE